MSKEITYKDLVKKYLVERYGERIEREIHITYEGNDIVAYTNNFNLFLDGENIAKEIASKIKKRVFIRFDPNFLTSQDYAEDFIRKKVPEEAKLTKIFFDPYRSIVYIEAKYPERITKEVLDTIKRETRWIPEIKRSPLIKSPFMDYIRNVLYQNSLFRKKFLDSIGEKVYISWNKDKSYWIRLSFLGAAREVGRSAILLQTKNSSVLLDCGINIATRNSINEFPRFDVPEFNIGDLDAIIISHAHLDHCGAIPYLIKMGYDGPIYVTPPTLHLMIILLSDYLNILQRGGKDTFFSFKEINEIIKRTVLVDYFKVTDVTPDVRLTFYPAGHVLGSAMIHLNVGNGTHNLLYTGDFKFSKTYLHDPAYYKFERLETLIIESTYGGKGDYQASREESAKKLVEIILETYKKGGKTLIPVLGLGRAQEVMIILDKAYREGILPKDIKVYVDGMIWDVTAIYTAFPNYLSRDFKKMFIEEGYNPFECEIFHRVTSESEREEIIKEGDPSVIIATSGMLNGGPIMTYFSELATGEKNSLIFTSYQASGTLGRVVQEGAREVLVVNEYGEEIQVKIKMRVESVEGLSGHSDRRELLRFIKKVTPKPKNVFTVHGEESKCLSLIDSIRKIYESNSSKKTRGIFGSPGLMDAVRIY